MPHYRAWPKSWGLMWVNDTLTLRYGSHAWLVDWRKVRQRSKYL